MVNGRFWFLSGCVFLGLLIGLVTGLSISPIVGTVVGLVFAFAGGSLIALIKGRSESDLDLIGKSLTLLSIAMIFGIALGIIFREDYLDIFSTSAPFKLKERISVNDIIELSKDNKVDESTLISLLRADGSNNKDKISLQIKDIKKMANAGVKANVLNAMFNEDIVSITNRENSNISPFLHRGSPNTPEEKLVNEVEQAQQELVEP